MPLIINGIKFLTCKTILRINRHISDRIKSNLMIHPDTKLEFISPEVGYGVVATHLIPTGTVTWVLDKLDREFDPEEVESFEPVYRQILDTYCYRNNRGKLILCWDHARFVNHSFNSNCLTTAYDFEIAIRNIMPGEQLTDDYGYLNIDTPFRGIDEGTRRKIVYPDDLPKYYKVWDKKLKHAFKNLSGRSQPLKNFIPDTTWEKALLISKGKVEMDSILTCYYPNHKL